MDTFTALAEPTRRNILELLANSGQMSATDICKKFSATPPAISQHLKILREARLVDMEKKAQQRIYSLNTQPLVEMDGWIKKMTQMWNARFDALDRILQEEKQKLHKKEVHAKTK